jgi:hypothetical protein
MRTTLALLAAALLLGAVAGPVRSYTAAVVAGHGDIEALGAQAGHGDIEALGAGA